MKKSFSIKRVFILLFLAFGFIILPLIAFFLGRYCTCAPNLKDAKDHFRSMAISQAAEALHAYEDGNGEVTLRAAISSLCNLQQTSMGCQVMGLYFLKYSDPCLAVPWFDEGIKMNHEHRFDDWLFSDGPGTSAELRRDRQIAVYACLSLGGHVEFIGR